MNAVEKGLKLARLLVDSHEAATSLKTEIIALGGLAGLDAYFLDAEGNERTDLGTTKTKFDGLLTTAQAYLTAMAGTGHLSNLYKMLN